MIVVVGGGVGVNVRHACDEYIGSTTKWGAGVGATGRGVGDSVSIKAPRMVVGVGGAVGARVEVKALTMPGTVVGCKVGGMDDDNDDDDDMVGATDWLTVVGEEDTVGRRVAVGWIVGARDGSNDGHSLGDHVVGGRLSTALK